MNKTILIIIAFIIGAGGGFFGGAQYQKSKNSMPSFQQFGNGAARVQGGQGMAARSGNNSGFVAGEIIKKDDKSITIKMAAVGNGAEGAASGGSKIVYYSDSTAVNKSVDGAKDDLAIGQNVMVTGTANSDGSVVAQVVQIRPEDGLNLNGGGQNTQGTVKTEESATVPGENQPTGQ